MFFDRLKEKKRKAAEREESRKMRTDLVDKVCAMTDEQFAFFVKKACEQFPELREKCEKSGLLDG